jgi:two-component system phosphate regulon response regulator PhoB
MLKLWTTKFLLDGLINKLNMEKLIQIVEDNADISCVVQFILEDAGYDVEMFKNAEAFVNRPKKENVSLFILDVMLPDGNGIELSKALKTDAFTFHIPVIIMSAHSTGNIAMQEGKAAWFIQKPFELDSFVSKVNEIIKIYS